MNGPMDQYPFRRVVPPGDTHERDVCAQCQWIHYVNPKIVCGAVVSHAERVLLCRRAIEPRRGFWTMPAGYMELHESCEQAATREAREEALAEIRIDALLGVYSIPRISQVQMIYRATLEDPAAVGAGEESLEVAWFDWDAVPWDGLAFPSVHWSLNHWRQVRGRDGFAPFTTPAEALHAGRRPF